MSDQPISIPELRTYAEAQQRLPYEAIPGKTIVATDTLLALLNLAVAARDYTDPGSPDAYDRLHRALARFTFGDGA